MIGLNIIDPDLKKKTGKDEIKFDLKSKPNKLITLDKVIDADNKDSKKKCCK